MKGVTSNRIRVALLVCITALNMGLFAVSHVNATEARSCKRCQWRGGGALGVYVDCMGDGWVEQCRPDLDFCWGRRCGEFDGDEESFDPEPNQETH